MPIILRPIPIECCPQPILTAVVPIPPASALCGFLPGIASVSLTPTVDGGVSVFVQLASPAGPGGTILQVSLPNIAIPIVIFIPEGSISGTGSTATPFAPIPGELVVGGIVVSDECGQSMTVPFQSTVCEPPPVLVFDHVEINIGLVQAHLFLAAPAVANATVSLVFGTATAVFNVIALASDFTALVVGPIPTLPTIGTVSTASPSGGDCPPSVTPIAVVEE